MDRCLRSKWRENTIKSPTMLPFQRETISPITQTSLLHACLLWCQKRVLFNRTNRIQRIIELNHWSVAPNTIHYRSKVWGHPDNVTLSMKTLTLIHQFSAVITWVDRRASVHRWRYSVIPDRLQLKGKYFNSSPTLWRVSWCLLSFLSLPILHTPPHTPLNIFCVRTHTHMILHMLLDMTNHPHTHTLSYTGSRWYRTDLHINDDVLII